MALVAGEQLGPYEIVAPLGAGGMGEVYRARDTRLGREVALKILPAGFARDADRLRRFEQEARATGLLNHPNILAIHDVGSHAGLPYVVSELLDGETLRKRLGAGAIPARKATEYALQIAHGLAAAHDRGIAHRDLKPENLFVTRDGLVKILDFGLAKLAHAEPSAAGETDAPTVPLDTAPGVVLGTAGYMSPEQVRGQPSDHRSDIFAFGVILYEMLAGKRAFRRESSVETMSAILTQDPPDLLQINPAVPAQLDRVVRHCLEKNPDDRFQSARDLAFDLESVSLQSGTSAALAAGAPRTGKRLVRWILAGIALPAFLAIAFVAARRTGTAPQPSFQRLTFRRGTITSARFAPDGQTMVYGAAWEGDPVQIFSTRPDSPESRPLGLPSADVLAVSSSGEVAVSLGRRFLQGWLRTGTLARVPLAGGAPREILEDVREADWLPDGSLAVVHEVGGRYRLESPVGKVLYETDGWISHPRASPAGNLIAFLEHPLRPDDGGSLMTVDLAGNRRVLSGRYSSTQGVAWSPSGEEIWLTGADHGLDRALWAVTPSGRSRLIARAPGHLTLQDISRDGRVLFSHDNIQSGISFGAGEKRERELSWFDFSAAFDISADGKTVLFSEQGAGAGKNYGVYTRKTDGSPAVRLGDGLATALSPDGKWVITVSLTTPPEVVLLPTGAGEPRRVPRHSIQSYAWINWLPDGQHIVFAGNEPDHGMRLYVQDLAGGKPRPISPEGVGGPWFPASPDGKLIVAVNSDWQYCLYPVGGGEARPIPGLDRADEAVGWDASGRALYVHRVGPPPASIYRLDPATGRRILHRRIMPADATGVITTGPFRITPDGVSYVYSYLRVLSQLYQVTGWK